MTNYEARCHCGAIGYTFHTNLAPPAWTLRACQCSFCRAHATLTASDPSGAIAFHEHEIGTLERYRFGLRTADFLLCRRCGVYIGAEIETPRGRYGIVNLRAIQPLPSGLKEPAAVNDDAEDTGQRVARREQLWTPVKSA